VLAGHVVRKEVAAGAGARVNVHDLALLRQLQAAAMHSVSEAASGTTTSALSISS
jgi:hypothetical protein